VVTAGPYLWEVYKYCIYYSQMYKVNILFIPTNNCGFTTIICVPSAISIFTLKYNDS